MADVALPIVGEKVVIRRLAEDDLNQMYDLESDPNVKRYLDGPVKLPREQWIAGMRSRLDDTLAVTTKASGDFAGRASLTATGLPLDSWEVRVVIASKYRGDYLGREVCQLLIGIAFDRLRSSSVVAVVHPDNARSLTLCKELGFTWDGTTDHERRVLKLPSEKRPKET
jgi:ribosomal-protein-alanine N-acetyltransferase